MTAADVSTLLSSSLVALLAPIAIVALSGIVVTVVTLVVGLVAERRDSGAPPRLHGTPRSGAEWPDAA